MITCIYLRPNLKMNEFGNKIKTVHEMQYNSKNFLDVLTGDINCRAKLWSPEEECHKDKELRNLLLHLKMTNIFDSKIEKPTRVSNNCESWIDIILTSSKLKEIKRNQKVVDIDASDHKMIVGELEDRGDITQKEEELKDRLAKYDSYSPPTELPILPIDKLKKTARANKTASLKLRIVKAFNKRTAIEDIPLNNDGRKLIESGPETVSDDDLPIISIAVECCCMTEGLDTFSNRPIWVSIVNHLKQGGSSGLG